MSRGTGATTHGRSNATQIVVGASRHSRWSSLVRGSVIGRVIRDSGVGIDVHVIRDPAGDEQPSPAAAPSPPPQRPYRDGA